MCDRQTTVVNTQFTLQIESGKPGIRTLDSVVGCMAKAYHQVAQCCSSTDQHPHTAARGCLHYISSETVWSLVMGIGYGDSGSSVVSLAFNSGTSDGPLYSIWKAQSKRMQ